ncbi:odorant-binding protein 7 isoform X1 [Acyrthosiphon pisum]|uniref:ACYPI001753 protein n=2 Tax=Acyrthosiphon pisum TaxID=7029 RepID=C4WWW9_ACYPI|nr:odorant-binding protein 7 precursor [Acyrthosiphon pisum]XP_008181612.1 odorant-binding protein 7 isoform X1 [Acyrthosiphon pisum]BAH72389.1 ACYPI001753 [Acyrthosiphon pisum]|eukprot:NP_001153533.1 odorant-binding protein 7 precursor [Acyrthosiphon pisum]
MVARKRMYNMLPTTVLFAIIAATVLKDCDAYLSEAAIKKTQQMLKTVCSKKHSVEEDVFTNIKKGIFPEDNNNIKCYFACNFKTMQLINQKGVIDKKMFKDKMSMMAPPNVYKILLPVIEQCTGKDKGEELCQSSYNVIKCAHSVDPKSLEFLPL